ncbi:MAG: carboxypeptidase-like regulatory domain-containing protein, partial [Limnochordia bacterium]|nr:carboxypeptidase-like regulatory domain-containing protein [Limnochordia bacterium]
MLFTVEPLASGEWTALSGAKIEVKNVSTGKKRFGTTEYDGYYKVRNLDVGYSILTVSHRALRHDVHTEVYVYPGEPT